eukprot:CAMPEP_0173386690 /NCGR_PEP_ID=MMETSP1356-20130122/9281_1 /TAXON_ID=77927 ORGANISM="Hemiselmis virescens, Strain PCC157" /NCGR_SAMPLE_ID=MMETSP1356 /ASSEMBLY_ACC=CAM_ASM_000847 /LENGTH=33 /DNA_ID= /DNA_START= /DNA_END= /DNA_ORIENTATION=
MKQQVGTNTDRTHLTPEKTHDDAPHVPPLLQQG